MRRLFFIFLIIILFSLFAHSQEPKLIGSISIGNANTLFGRRILPIGDQNGDGYDDIIIYESRSSPEPQFDNTYFFYGGDSTNSTPFLTLDGTNPKSENIGDINGDGVDDLIIPIREIGKNKIGIYYGGLYLDSIRDLWFGEDTLHGIGYSVRGFDINENGTDEIISWSNEQDAVLLFEIGSAYDTIPDLVIKPPNQTFGSYSNFGKDITSGDFNGDNKVDLAVNYSPKASDSTNGSIYLYWGSPTFDTIPDMIITRQGEYAEDQTHFGWVLESLGDFNGDGYDDFYAGANPSQDITGFIYFGGPSIDDVPDITIPEIAEEARLAGDINNDGYNDLISSYPLPFSGSGKVSIYFGGPSADSVADIVHYNWEDPRYQTEFGMDCAGVGDFNGDGVDDYAFSFLTSSAGEVYVYSGLVSTDVEYQFEPNLPDNFSLSQNYPNPFNPSTTIEFQIPNRQHVTLSVYNTLGQCVRTLIDKDLPVGSYSLAWDGKNDGLEDVASGVYLYKLEAGEFVLSKKMVLMQ